mgnify:FL=1
MSHNAMCPFLWFVVRLVFVENISQQQKIERMKRDFFTANDARATTNSM